MAKKHHYSGLYVDHYELSMAQGYFFSGQLNQQAGFDYFFRKNPFKGGYVIFTGLEELLKGIREFIFNEDECQYLKSIGFHTDFVDYLRQFEFKGDIYAPNEGEVVFSNEPLIRVEGDIIETQLLETLLLNIINFSSLISTKASRMRLVAGDKPLVDFGLRRAHSTGGILASKAAVCGGFNSTSNVDSAFGHQLNSSGTMAHSWVQFYRNELEAFRIYAQLYGNESILLVDTYDTLKSGMPNAIKVAKEMEQNGNQIKGIRLDSGDLAYLSKKAREMLDNEGLKDVDIIASNQLDEYIIQSLMNQKAPVDAFGVGTSLVTGQPDAALDGVYKLTTIGDEPTMKISENKAKMTLPGKKKIYRCIDDSNMFVGDGIFLSDENEQKMIFHPVEKDKKMPIDIYKKELLLKKVFENGNVINDLHFKANDVADYVHNRLLQLPDEYKRFINPHIYKVGISEKLMVLRDKQAETLKSEI